jgi:hypothetical protein
MRVCVKYSEICTHSEHSGEQYGDWSESWSCSVESAYVLGDDEKQPYDSEVFLLPDDTTRVHVVYMIYDTGDSFGRADGKISIVHCTANEDAAHQIAKMIQDDPEQFSFKFTDDFGRKISLYNSGAGYFERISYVEVESFDLGKKKRYHIN